jgi:hypothetical protein
VIENVTYYVGDVVKIIDTKANMFSHFQMVLSENVIFLENKNNRITGFNYGYSKGIYDAYIPITDIINGVLPFIKIERIGNSAKDLKLVKRIKMPRYKYRG